MLVLHHDHCSPAAVVAGLRLQRLADEGADVVFVGMDTLGLDAAVPVTLDMLAELRAHGPSAADLGVRMRQPSRRPPTLSAHVLGDLAVERGLGAAWRLACWRAYWEDDADIGDHQLLLDTAAGVGLDRARAAERLEDRAAHQAVRQRMVSARSRGIGGVPVLEVAGALVSGLLPEEALRELAGL